MLDKYTTKIVGENLDWFFKRILNEHYSRRRQVLRDGNQSFELMPAIDYIMKTCIDESSTYPPDCVARWHEYFMKLGSGYSHVFQQLLIMYLKLDITNYLSIRERESTTGKQTRAKDRAELAILEGTLVKLANLPHVFDFSTSLIKLSTGLWAMDNEQLGLMVSCLTDPAVNLSNFFETTKDLIKIIVGTLNQCNQPHMALYMSRIHRYDNWDEDYDQMYAFLLISSGQLVEALKYERMFMEQENYTEILQNFFELSSKLDVTSHFNKLNLSVEEEEVLNQHFVIESSRPVTPASYVSHQTRRVTISESATPTNSTKRANHTPRNRHVQSLRKMPSFSDSPAKNTRSARKRK